MGPLHFVRKGMLVFCIWERPHSFSCFYLPALFDTTSRALGGGLELRWRSPMGDLRIAYGVPLVQDYDKEMESGRLEFSMGQFF